MFLPLRLCTCRKYSRPGPTMPVSKTWPLPPQVTDIPWSLFVLAHSREIWNWSGGSQMTLCSLEFLYFLPYLLPKTPSQSNNRHLRTAGSLAVSSNWGPEQCLWGCQWSESLPRARRQWQWLRPRARTDRYRAPGL